MKYKIIQDNLRFGEEGEILPDAEAELLNIPILLEIGIFLLEKGYIEEVKEDWKRWRADRDKLYYYLGEEGEINHRKDDYNFYDDFRYDIGNYFKTQEEAQQKLDRDLAIARVNNRIRELQGGEVSREEMMDIEIYNWEIFYNVYDKKYDYSCSHNYFLPILLPIRTKEISQQIIKECKYDLDIILGINK